MDIVMDTPVMDAIWDAWQGGAMIAGTSAGAAVMSEK
jgi:cyanophycinase